MNLIAWFNLLVFADEPDLAKCETATFRYPLGPSHQAARRHDRNRSGPDQLEPCTAPCSSTVHRMSDTAIAGRRRSPNHRDFRLW